MFNENLKHFLVVYVPWAFGCIGLFIAAGTGYQELFKALF